MQRKKPLTTKNVANAYLFYGTDCNIALRTKERNCELIYSCDTRKYLLRQRNGAVCGIVRIHYNFQVATHLAEHVTFFSDKTDV